MNGIKIIYQFNFQTRYYQNIAVIHRKKNKSTKRHMLHLALLSCGYFFFVVHKLLMVAKENFGVLGGNL